MDVNEIKILADKEKQLAIDNFNSILELPEGYSSQMAEAIVNQIINASLLYSAEMQARSSPNNSNKENP